MKRSSTYGNRGMALEMYVITSNMMYRNRGIALISKIPIPITVLKIINGRIKDGFYEDKSIVDFVGNYKGKHIAFDTKSTENKTSFPLKNIEEHQYEYLRNNHQQQGVSFILVEFAKHHEIYILRFEDLDKWWNEAKQGGAKSIKYEWFKENCYLCTADRGIALDYLQGI